MTPKSMMSAPLRPIASRDGLKLAFPENTGKSLGALIVKPASAELIEGVRVEPFSLFPDDRGYFLEVQRMGCALISDYDPRTTQISAALSYPGTIKAFHYHLRQTDCWTVALGMLQVALVDLRAGSRTFGTRNTLYVGALRPWHVLIPPGVAHGYKVLGGAPAMLVYLTDRVYDPSDEGRIAYDDHALAYDWDTQFK